MAEVANSTGLGRQLFLVIMVRWQIFRNGLRSRSEKVHMVGSVALGLFFTVLVLGASAGICFAAFAFVKARIWIALSMLLWGIFLFWQFVPVLAAEMNPGFDGRNLLRFPLRFSAFFLMSAAYGVADPFAARRNPVACGHRRGRFDRPAGSHVVGRAGADHFRSR